jgi:hypothetical protein
MPYGELSFVGGLVNGIAQAQMQRMQQAQGEELAAQKSEESKLRQAEIKLKNKQLELEQQKAEKFGPLADEYIAAKTEMMRLKRGGGIPQGGSNATPSGAQLGQSITGEMPVDSQTQRISDLMAAISLYESDPFIANMIESYGGLKGFGKMPDFNLKQQDFTRKQGMDEWNKAKAAGEVQYHQLNVGGEQLLVPTYKNPELRAMREGQAPQNLGAIPPPLGGIGSGTFQGQQGGGMPPLRGEVEPKVEEFTQNGERWKRRVNPYTGVQVGDAWKLEESKGAESARTDFAAAETILGKLENLMNDVIPKDGSDKNDLLTVLNERMAGVSRQAGAKIQTNPKAAEFNAFVNGTLAPMIRALGEKGALANQDVERALSMMPLLTDRPSVAWGKYKNIRGIMTEAKAAKAGKNNGSDNTLPDAAAKMLSEGQITTFGNGQQWTIINGVKKRIK